MDPLKFFIRRSGDNFQQIIHSPSLAEFIHPISSSSFTVRCCSSPLLSFETTNLLQFLSEDVEAARVFGHKEQRHQNGKDLDIGVLFYYFLFTTDTSSVVDPKLFVTDADPTLKR
jgi:hypothetical protein